MVPWQKPETAFRRATELLEVGRKQDALDTLHEVIKNRRARLWSKVHEQIMMKHLELCVELRKPHLAKDGLFQYRNMCQQVNAKSLEDVIQSFLELSEKKAEQARLESHGIVEDVDDLDQAESPEKLLLAAVSGEGAQERSERTILSPWLRFLWESYRQCLELLRNNMQVETLYHKVAKQAFAFCLKFQRKTEFRKLCDNLRTHLIQIQKAQHNSHYALKLSNPETLAMHQETRLTQLDIAIQMALWQEAFKSVEDVHQLMQLSKKQVRTSALVSYYEKLALIFWKADCILYHAAVLVRLFPLTKELKRTVSSDELQQLATRALLAVLSVPATVGSDLSRHLEMDEINLENQRRLATFLMLPAPPTRQSLLKDVMRLNINNMALPTTQNLYRLLETDFCPLTLASCAAKEFEAIAACDKSDNAKYLTALKDVAAFKILKQVSQVYSTAAFAFLGKIIPFFDRSAIERLVVMCGKKSLIQVRLQHRTESVEFGLNESGSADEMSLCGGAVGPMQCVTSASSGPPEAMRQHLQQMYKALNEAASAIDIQRSASLADSLQQQITVYAYHKHDQNVALLNRKRKIEQYKEQAEHIRSTEEERQKDQQKREHEEKQRLLETKLQQEMKERQEQQKLRDQEDLQKRIMQDRLDKMKDPKLRKIIEDLPEDELKNLDNDLILQKQISHLEKEKREHLAKLKQQEKKWDYLVRAMHVEEIELRQAEYAAWSIDDKNDWETYETHRIEKAEFLVQTVERMKLIKEAEGVISKIRESHTVNFTKQLADWEKKLNETRQQRLNERKDERKAKRRAEWLAQKKEIERKKKDEDERQKREQEMAARGGDRYRRGGTEQQGPGEGEMWEKNQQLPGGATRPRRMPPLDDAEAEENLAAKSNWRIKPPVIQPSVPENVRQPSVSRPEPPSSDWRSQKPLPPAAAVHVDDRSKSQAYHPPRNNDSERPPVRNEAPPGQTVYKAQMKPAPADGTERQWRRPMNGAPPPTSAAPPTQQQRSGDFTRHGDRDSYDQRREPLRQAPWAKQSDHVDYDQRRETQAPWSQKQTDSVVPQRQQNAWTKALPPASESKWRKN